MTAEEANGFAPSAAAIESNTDAANLVISPKDMNEFIPLLYKLLERTVNHSTNTDKAASSEDSDSSSKEEQSADDKETIEKENFSDLQKKNQFTDHALVTKQIFDADRKLEKTVVEINSPHIRVALKEVVKYYPSESLKFDPPEDVIFQKPYALLQHHKSELAQYASEAIGSGKPDADSIKAHIDLLLNFLDVELGDEGLALRKLTESGLINFDLLWAIFKPGDLLLNSEFGHPRIYRCRRAGYGEDKQKGKYFNVNCEFTNGDGVKFGTSTVSIKLWQNEDFIGKDNTAIDRMPLVPLQYVDDREALMEQLTERGRRYLDIRGITSWDYNGLFLYLKRPPFDFYNECSSFDGIWLPRSANQRIVVDPKTFVEEATKKAEGVEDSDDCEECSGKGTSKPSALLSTVADPLLCPPFAYGFSLETKEWCKFFLDCLVPVDWTSNAMDSLIVPETQRNLVKALVTSHRFPDPEQARNEAALKGKGLIILLHGTPGSGKTLTAELAAEHTKRPLLKVSTGELGSWETQLSFELQRLLTYASIWQAIVLIDEADVFLEARRSGPHQFEQNNLVAIFLKQLEYFQGILFMTSNRVNIFDPAIRSRLHLALQYNAPDAERRKSLWRQKLEQVSAEDKHLDIEDCVQAMHKAEMNGREISNAVNTALTLAESGSGKLGIDHLKAVLGVWEEFESTLRNIEHAD